MRLTPEVLRKAKSCLNVLQERELVLRGLGVPAIENLGVLEDQYDTIDLTDNAITRLENFPRMRRLTTLLLSENNINHISGKIAENISGIRTMVLSNNAITSLEELNGLSGLNSLSTLSLLGNEVTKEENYRLYVIHTLPSLKYLDFNRVTVKDREKAKELFDQPERKSTKRRRVTAKQKAAEKKAQTEQRKRRKLLESIKDEIKNAKTIEELRDIEKRRLELQKS